MFVGMALGLLLWAVTRRYESRAEPRDGFMLVSFLWIGFAATATTPFLLHFPDLGLYQCLFRGDERPDHHGCHGTLQAGSPAPGHQLLATFPQLAGRHGHHRAGRGRAAAPRDRGMQLYKAETPGPMKDSKLSPRITHTAKNLWFAYALLTAACVVALRLAGMDWFDAVCHAFAALSLGGFSTHDASVGYFNFGADRSGTVVLHVAGRHEFCHPFPGHP